MIIKGHTDYAATIAIEDLFSFDHSYVSAGDTLKVLDKDGNEVKEGIVWNVYKLVSGGEDDACTYSVLVKNRSASELKITSEYMGCLVYADIALGDDSERLTMYTSELPVMYINSDTDYYGVSKDDYTDADTTTINLVGNDTYADEDFWYSGNAQVKLRGNSTASREKRPFKIKLSSKADLLGLGTEDDGTSYKSKHWVLLANDIDHSLLRNKLLYDFSGDIGTEYYFKSTNVVLIYNGQYEGVYQLCEQRRVDEGRIDITDWTGVGEKAALAIGDALVKSEVLENDDKKEFVSDLEEAFASDYSWIDDGMISYSGKYAEALAEKLQGEDGVTIETEKVDREDATENYDDLLKAVWSDDSTSWYRVTKKGF